MIRVEPDHVVSRVEVYAALPRDPFGLECVARRVKRLRETVARRVDAGPRLLNLEDLLSMHGVARRRRQEFRQYFCATPLPGEGRHRFAEAFDPKSTEQ